MSIGDQRTDLRKSAHFLKVNRIFQIQIVGVRIQVTLRTQNTVNTGGQLVILAPLEFGFDPEEGSQLIQGDKQTRCLIMEYEHLG